MTLPRLSDFFVLSEPLTFSLSVVPEVNHFNPYEKRKENSYWFLTLGSIYRKDILVPIFRKVRYRNMKIDWLLDQSEAKKGEVDVTTFHNKGLKDIQSS
jgi:hypothetical protein